MDTFEQLKGDLGFVRAVVDKADRQAAPTAIYFLWAIVGFCGFALADFGNRWVCPSTGPSQVRLGSW